MVLESNTLDVLFVKDGQQGEDGKILYTWIKYAKDANGTGMTDDPNGAVYIGISYNNESSTESNDPAQYAWTKIQGADGKKGEDAYTIFLENENISFATDENRDPLSEQAYTSGITIMKGAKPVTDFTIGDIAKTQGIAVAKTDTAIAISVINGNPLPNDSGAIEIPITVGGTVFKKILSWTCAQKGIQGIQGPQGAQGEKGKDGTSVTITNKSITYQLSTSGTTIPTGTWQTSPQTIPEGQYQWTKTSVTYSDGNKTESYSISYRGKNGSNGTSVKTTSTSVKYQVGDSGTTKPTGTWQNNVPTVAQGKYLWTQTIVNYSDGNSTESYSVSYRGIDGSNGSNGMNAATVYLYQRATSTPSKPSNTLTYTFSTTKITGTLNNGWSTAIPTGTDAVYVTVASVSSKNDTVTIATSAWSAPVVLAQNGKTGSDGKAGLNVATIYLYQRATSKPSKPSASVTYTFSTGVASGLNNGWSQKIPDGTNPLYVTLATASSNTATDTILSSEWSDVVVMAQNGEDGQDGISPKVSLSKSGNTTTISIVDATGTHTQTVKDGTNGTPGTAGKDGKTSYFHVKYSNDGGKTFTGNSGEDTGIYMGSYTDYTEADSTDVKKYTWVKVKGDKGDTGQKGQDGTSITITSKSVTYQTSTSGTTVPTGTWSTTVPTVNNGQYLWTKTTVQYSDGNKTEAYSVSYKGTNGTNGTSVTVSKTEVTYQVSTSGTTAPTGTWSTTMPSCDQGLYLWTKTYVKYSDGKDTTSYSVSYKGVDGQDGKNATYITVSGTNFDAVSGINGTASYLMINGVKYNYNSLNRGHTLAVINPSNGAVESIKTYDTYTTPSTLDEPLTAVASGKIICLFTADASSLTTSSRNTLIGCGSGLTTTWSQSRKTHVFIGMKGLSKGQAYEIVASGSDATKTITAYYTPSGIVTNGATGEKGDNAKNLSITPSSQYFKSTDGGKTFAPSTITIKPTIQGEISFGKWQYSIDGGVSFADVVSGQKGLTISNNVLTVSKDSSLYSDAVTMVTFRAVANDSSFYDTCSIAKIYDVSDIQIGGRNLVLNSDKEYVMGYGIPNTTWTDGYAYIELPTTRLTDEILPQNNAFLLHPEAGKTYTQTIWIETDADVIDLNAAKISWFTAKYGHVTVPAKIIKLADNSYKLTSTHTVSQDDADIRLFDIYHLFSAFNILNSGTYLKFGKLKVEQGNVSTDWTPAPEDLQTAILSTKSEISSVSSKVDQNTKSIENRVEKTTYERELTLVKGDISKANEGLNKWRYEIYPKSLFTDKPEDQSKYDIGVFIRNKNLTPSQSVLLDDASLSTGMDYGDSHIAYGLTFIKMSAAKSVTTTFYNDDGASFYVNGKQIISTGGNYTSGTSITFSLVKGWNCLEIVLNEGNGSEGFKFAQTLSKLSECQLMNCYYGTPVARQSHITNQLVQNTTDIDGVSGSVQRVMSTVGGSGKIDEFVNNYSTWKKKVDGIETRVGETYTTKDDFNGLEIGGRNLLTKDDCNMSKWQNLYPAHCKITNNEYSNHIDYVPTGGEWEIIYKKISVTKGQKYILSFDYKVNKAYNYLSGQKYGVYLSTSVPTNAAPANIITNGQYVIENTVTNIKRGMITFTATADTLYVVINGGCIDDNQTGLSFEFNKWKLEKGSKATDWTPAPEDDEINGQNLVSNLPSNWEQGSFNDGKTNVGCDYDTNKSSMTTRIRVKELVPVSGTITISNAYSNQSKKPIQNMITAFDVNKKWLGSDYVSTAWSDFPRIVDMKDAKYIAVIVKYKDESAITPSDISQICLKIERGTSATPFTLAPEDVNGKIVNVETIANQTAKKFEWIVKSGDKSSSMVLTDDFLNIVANNINLTGKVTFNSFDQSLKDNVSATSGNLITITPANPKTEYDSVAYTVDTADRGEKCIKWTTANSQPYLIFTSYYTPNIFRAGDRLYYDLVVPNWSSTITTGLGVWFYDKNKKYLSNKLVNITLTGGQWNHITGYINMPAAGSSWNNIYYYNLGIENKGKAIIGLCSSSYIEKTTSYATTYASSAVNWVTTNGSSTTSLNSMVKKWTDGAVSDTTQVNGGWIKANTITASKIAIGDFTNYCQLDKDSASSYGFTATDDTKGVWFTASPIDRDKNISQWFTCEGSQKLYVEYDLSTTVKGKVNASDATTSYLTSGIMIFAANGTKEIISYTRSKGVIATSDGTVTHISLVETLPADARFFKVVLQTDGKRNTFSGTLKIRNPQVRKATTGKLIVDGSITADKIATDAIKSRNYDSSGGTQGSFLNLSDGSFTSPNLSWDSNGNLIATGANLSGQITATEGKIGKFKITDQWLITGSGSTCAGLGGSGQAFWSGAENSTVAPFRVDYDGKFISSNADISGKITATEGTIGKYEITDTCLITGSGSTCTGIGGNFAFWAGGEDSYFAPFRVGYDGQLNIEHIKVHGNQEDVHMTIAKDYLEIQDVNTSAYIGLDGFDFDFANSRIKTGDQGIELYGSTPYIDFHYNNSSNDYTSRIIAQLGWDCLTFTGSILLGGSIYNSSGGHYTWDGRDDAYLGCGNYSGGNNIYYYANYHAFYVNNDSGSGMMYINTNGVTSRVGFTKTSDERIKKNFESFDNNIIDAYMNIEPVKYQLKQSSNDKYHFGFKAQHIDKVFSDYGESYNESFDICTSRPIDPNKSKELYGVDDMTEEYGLRYDELIAPTTYMVQYIYKELEQVKQEKADLEARLQAIEAKLGLEERINN